MEYLKAEIANKRKAEAGSVLNEAGPSTDASAFGSRSASPPGLPPNKYVRRGELERQREEEARRERERRKAEKQRLQQLKEEERERARSRNVSIC